MRKVLRPYVLRTIGEKLGFLIVKFILLITRLIWRELMASSPNKCFNIVCLFSAFHWGKSIIDTIIAFNWSRVTRNFALLPPLSWNTGSPYVLNSCSHVFAADSDGSWDLECALLHCESSLLKLQCFGSSSTWPWFPTWVNQIPYSCLLKKSYSHSFLLIPC